nr:MAG TPA: hypothetical protein [Caudoviricetes sp.]
MILSVIEYILDPFSRFPRYRFSESFTLNCKCNRLKTKRMVS